MSKPFYITTAIDYVNGQPHLGHAYEKIITDVIARARRSFGEPVFYLTGLDEHGQKVQQAAIKDGKSPQAYCDELAADWKAFAGTLNLTNDDFVRTTEARHKATVQAILTKLNAAGHFYQAEYRGFYSQKEETFLTEKDRQPDGNFDPSYGEVVELVEHNYYFKLKDHQQWLIDYIEAHPEFIQPDYRRNEVLGFLKNNTLEDLCITRPASRLNWGIPLPFDPGYVTYVWFDALVNYISVPASLGDPTVCAALPELKLETQSAKRSLWPADVHVLGKDILKFHAVYWPIMLRAIFGVEADPKTYLPKQLLAHGWWQKDGAKISKSTGNIVEPNKVIGEWGVDAFRYYVVRELSIGPDGNWTDESFVSRYDSELANGLGNLLNRSLSMLKKYRNGLLPQPTTQANGDSALVSTNDVPAIEADLRAERLQSALIKIQEIITRANQYIQKTEPFRMAKVPEKAAELDVVLYNLVETCRILAVLLWPFIPATSEKIYAQLGLKGAPEKFSEAAWGQLAAGHAIGEPAALFPRKDLAPK